jgi:hypothetical protein
VHTVDTFDVSCAGCMLAVCIHMVFQAGIRLHYLNRVSYPCLFSLHNSHRLPTHQQLPAYVLVTLQRDVTAAAPPMSVHPTGQHRMQCRPAQIDSAEQCSRVARELHRHTPSARAAAQTLAQERREEEDESHCQQVQANKQCSTSNSQPHRLKGFMERPVGQAARPSPNRSWQRAG